MSSDKKAFLQEFDRQTENLLTIGYPLMTGLSVDAFLILLEPLKESLSLQNIPDVDLQEGILPFVIVIKSGHLSAEKMMAGLSWQGKPGITKLFPHTSTDFNIIESVNIPGGLAYLVTGIDRGKQTLNVRPEDALKMIQNNNRSPLTIDEGIALITHFPEFLIKNNCFSLLASRHSGDQRVPAIWINGQKQANLGWCWDRNPHTWLGSASCGKRIGL